MWYADGAFVFMTPTPPSNGPNIPVDASPIRGFNFRGPVGIFLRFLAEETNYTFFMVNVRFEFMTKYPCSADHAIFSRS